MEETTRSFNYKDTKKLKQAKDCNNFEKHYLFTERNVITQLIWKTKPIISVTFTTIQLIQQQ